MKKTDEIMVSIICTTYNQERYIGQAIESFLAQETDFGYEILIHDDASTDRTAEVVRSYESKHPDKIRVIYQTENQFSKGISPSQYLFPMARGKYIADCEGDDFWTDKDKLQTQVAYMEEHPNASACVHAAYYARENGDFIKERLFRPYEQDEMITLERLFTRGWLFATNSIMYRKSCREIFVPPFRGKCKNGDFALAVYLASQGDVFYIDKVMSAYRVESVGSINWKWRSDPKRYKKDKMEFLCMLDRIDEYLEFKYHDLITIFRQKNEFEMYRFSMDLKGARKYPDKYKQLSLSEKAKMYFIAYVPGSWNIYYGLKNLKQKRKGKR